MSRQRILFAAVCAFALAACGQAGSGGAGAPADTATNNTTSAAPSSCDSPAVGLGVGADAQGEIPTTTQGYPANARYYCVEVPAGVSRLTLDLTGMSVDLDLYVGHGSIGSVQGVNLEAGQTYQWKSNEFGAVDEHVVIDNPQPGIYYAEIVSYQGQGSQFRLAAR